MKIRFHKYYILIKSQGIVDLLAKIVRLDEKDGRKKAMGFALFPSIIVLREDNHPMNQQWINHEKIHLVQSFSTLGLSFIISVFEYLYARIILKYSHKDAYLYESMEQEAYLNQHNPEYLKTRKITDYFKYISSKKRIRMNDNYEVIVEEHMQP